MSLELVISRIAQRLRGRRVIPAIPVGNQILIPIEDDVEEEVQLDEDQGSAECPVALFIIYRDARGQQSQRRITCKRMEPGGSVLAFCHERNQFRRFKLDRILDAVDIASGEVIDTASLARGIPMGPKPLSDRRLIRLLTVFTFVMRCDGKAHHLEREVIEGAVATFALRFDGDDALIEAGMAVTERLSPDIDDMIDALRWIEKHPDGVRLARLAMPVIDRVIVADGTIASQEAYFGGIVKDALEAIISGKPAF